MSISMSAAAALPHLKPTATAALPQLKPTATAAQIAAFPTTLSSPLTTPTKAFSITCSSSTFQTSTPVATDRVFNFATGLATLPEKVFLRAQSELYNWRGSGMSVMEMSHLLYGNEFD